MKYTINNRAIEDYGFKAGWIGSKGGAYALTGIWSLPKREGNTYYIWPGNIEPYIDADDIIFEPRDFELSLICVASSVEKFTKLLCDFLAEVGDSFQLNGYSVLLESANTKSHHNGWGHVVLKMKELNPMKLSDLDVLEPRPEGEEGIDGYGWQELGFLTQSLDDRYNLESWGSLNLTHKTHAHGSRQAKSLNLKGIIEAEDAMQFEARVKLLQSIIGRAGSRTVKYSDYPVFNAFCVDGFSINDVKMAGSKIWATFNCKMIKI